MFTYLVCTIFFASYISGLDSGSACKINGASGQCLPVRECLSAKESYNVNRTLPTICSNQKELYICCATDKAPDAHTPTTRRPTDGCEPLTSVTAPEVGQKSWHKCLEYQEKIVRPCIDILLVEGKFRHSECTRDTLALILENGVLQNEFPHMVLLGYGDDINSLRWLCEGAIISERFILTLASCSFHREYGQVQYIRTGVLNISDPVDSSRLFKIKRIIIHPLYEAPNPYNNIALLEIDNDIPLDLSTVPACIDAGNLPTYTHAVAIGWDGTDRNKSELQRGHLLEAPSDACVIPGGRNLYDEAIQRCYYNKDENDFQHIIQIENIKCMYVVTGLAFGRSPRHNRPGRPFTRVSAFVPWIESIVWP